MPYALYPDWEDNGGYSNKEKSSEFDYIAGDGLFSWLMPKNFKERVKVMNHTERAQFRLKFLAARMSIDGIAFLGFNFIYSITFGSVNLIFSFITSLVFFIPSLFWVLKLRDSKSCSNAKGQIKKRILFYRIFQISEIFSCFFTFWNMVPVFLTADNSVIIPMVKLVFIGINLMPLSICLHYAIRGVWHRTIEGRWGGVFEGEIIRLKRKYYIIVNRENYKARNQMIDNGGNRNTINNQHLELDDILDRLRNEEVKTAGIVIEELARIRRIFKGRDVFDSAILSNSRILEKYGLNIFKKLFGYTWKDLYPQARTLRIAYRRRFGRVEIDYTQYNKGYIFIDRK